MTMTGRIQPGIPLATPFQFSEEFSSTQRHASGAQQFPSACESVENGVFFGERFVEDSGAKLSWST